MEIDLTKFGLNYYEGKVLYTLFYKRRDIRDLSKNSKVPFGKIYSIIKSLKEKGLVQETNTRPKLIYIENVSEVISKLISEKERKETEAIERLRMVAAEADKSKGNRTKFFDIGTSIEDNKIIQLRTFNEAEKEVLQLINIHHKPQSNRKSKTLWEKAIVNAIGRGVTLKVIYPKEAKLPAILERLNKHSPDKFQVRRFNTDFVRYDIVDSKKVLIKLVHKDALQYGGVLFLEDKKLADNLKSIFYGMWEEALMED